MPLGLMGVLGVTPTPGQMSTPNGGSLVQSGDIAPIGEGMGEGQR